MAKWRKLPILSVVQVGSDEFERFLIRDQKERVWTGERFESGTGVLYAKENRAAAEIHSILRRNFHGVEPQRLVVPVYVEVLSKNGAVPTTEVAQYLSMASKMLIDTPTCGNGPGDSLVLPRIEWGRIRSIKEFPYE